MVTARRTAAMDDAKIQQLCAALKASISEDPNDRNLAVVTLAKVYFLPFIQALLAIFIYLFKFNYDINVFWGYLGPLDSLKWRCGTGSKQYTKVTLSL